MLMLLRRRSGLLYLLRATFSTDMAAPLPASLPTDVGGSLTVVQVDGQFSQSGGVLNVPAQSTPVWGDLGFYASVSVARVAGRSLFCTFTPSSAANGSFFGFGSGIGVNYTHLIDGLGMYFATATLRTINAVGAGEVYGSFAAATTYHGGIVLRGTGAFLVIKGGVYSQWTLIAILNTGATSTLYAMFSTLVASTLDDFRVLDLPAFATDALVYTNRLVAPAAGATTTSTADAWIEHTISTLPSADAVRLRVRKQDASNYWRVEATSAGAISLIETVATVDTSRGSVAAVVASGHRIVVVQQGTVIKVYSGTPAAPVLRITYSSATNFQTATAVELNTLGTGGVVSEVVAWPLYPTGLPA